MVNKITIGLLVLLLFFVGGFGYYTYTFHQQVNMMRVELNTFQNEQAARTEAIQSEIISLNNELRAGLDNLGAEIDKNIAHSVDLEDKVGASLAVIDTLEQRVSGNLEEIASIKQELTEAAEIAGPVMNTPKVYQKVNQAVVRISNGQGTVGSGFIYSSEGHVLTAHHVIDKLDEIYVIIPDGKVFPADVVGSCAFSDVAVLKIDDISGIEPPTMADSSKIKVGDPVAAIGSPFDLAESLNAGIISQMNRFADIEYDGQTRWVANLIQFDAAVNFGNSGGPLFDSDGGVIGLVIARVGPEEGDGIYYAVSSNKVRRVADSIIAQGYFDYPWLGIGISDLTPQQVQDIGLESINGVLVTQIVPDSPAKVAGVQVDDIIIAIDSTEARNVAEFTSYLGEYKSPGESTTLTVIRDTITIDMSLEIGLRE
ncbi:MAG: PDZ domain-containing protein [Dehalococcoidia bacterium]|nr:MAG: PDZ domain-containing protein [Dehalococcoidia bacterium]